MVVGGPKSPEKSRWSSPTHGNDGRETPVSGVSHMSPKWGMSKTDLEVTFGRPIESTFSTPRRSAGGRSSRSAGSSTILSEVGNALQTLSHGMLASQKTQLDQQKTQMDFFEGQEKTQM